MKIPDSCLRRNDKKSPFQIFYETIIFASILSIGFFNTNRLFYRNNRFDMPKYSNKIGLIPNLKGMTIKGG